MYIRSFYTFTLCRFSYFVYDKLYRKWSTRQPMFTFSHCSRLFIQTRGKLFRNMFGNDLGLPRHKPWLLEVYATRNKSANKTLKIEFCWVSKTYWPWVQKDLFTTTAAVDNWFSSSTLHLNLSITVVVITSGIYK